MFRDSHGVVHTVSSSDPMSDLPAGAAGALQQALLEVPTAGAAVDVGGVLERCDATRELLERWQDAFFAALPDEVDLEEEARWAAEAGLSLEEVEAGYEEDEDGEPDAAPAGLDDDGFGHHLDDLDSGGGLVADGEGDLASVVGLEALLGGEPAPDDPRRLLPDDLVAVLERELLLLPVRVRLEALLAAAELVEQWSDLVADREKLLGHLVLAHGELPGPQARSHEELAARHAGLHAASGPEHGPTT